MQITSFSYHDLWSHDARIKRKLPCPNDNAENAIERTLNHSCLVEISLRGTKNKVVHQKGKTAMNATQKNPNAI